MSDDRFDDDLQAVLLEIAPRDVPDDLRRRVAEIPTTPPARRRAWSLIPVLAAAAVVALALAIGLPLVGPTPPPDVGVEPSESSSADPTTGPSTSSGERSCEGSDLTGFIVGWQGAAGSRIAEVEVTNTSSGPCVLRGTPGLQLLDGNGAILIDSATAGTGGRPTVAPSDPTFSLAPGDAVRTDVSASNYCGPSPSLPLSIAFVVPGGGTFVAVPGSDAPDGFAVPPCSGDGGGAIAMNGWRR